MGRFKCFNTVHEPDHAQFRDYVINRTEFNSCSIKRSLDILLFSNIISSKKENARTNGYVWV